MIFENKTMIKFLLWGAIFACLANLPFYAWIFNKSWPFITGFPIGWIGTGMSYMGTFFHEIGHTIFLWFYGYPSVPAFDFQHGGGMAWSLSDQEILLLVLVWIGLFYCTFMLRDYLILVILCAFLFLLNICLAFNDYHHVVIDFMGAGSEALIASFFLYRAIFDLAPRGGVERFLNSFFGFGLIIQSFINGYGLLKSNAFRLVYYEQKGSHGFGDLDKVADRVLMFSFEGVVIFLIILNIICLIFPFLMYRIKQTSKEG